MQDFQQGSSITLYDEFGSTSYIQTSAGPTDPVNVSTNSANSRIYDQPISSYPLSTGNQHLSFFIVKDVHDVAVDRNWGARFALINEAQFIDVDGSYIDAGKADVSEMGSWCGIYTYLIPGKRYKYSSYGIDLSLDQIYQNDNIIVDNDKQEWGLIDGDFSIILNEKSIVYYHIKWVGSTM